MSSCHVALGTAVAPYTSRSYPVKDSVVFCSPSADELPGGTVVVPSQAPGGSFLAVPERQGVRAVGVGVWDKSKVSLADSAAWK